ncbi:MAG: hemerythrin family protein [Fibrobacteria bacterium]|nr:hemerythrin family protein [Fibrobacteria bacterium]
MSEVLELIEWKAEWSLGFPLIDEQHQKLVSMIRLLQEEFLADSPKDQTLLFVLFETLDYAVTHFAAEEALFTGRGWNLEASHIGEHEAFLDKARKSLESFRGSTHADREAVLQWLRDWLIHHITGSDRAIAAFLAASD